MIARRSPDLTFFPVHRQQIVAAFDGPDIVSDTGLLTVRLLDQQRGYLADLAARLPDPRSPKFIRHSAEELLAQQVYQILADYPEGNDADTLRHDPRFRTLAGRDPRGDDPLAWGSTRARFPYAFTRRQRERHPEDRPAFREMDQARTHRLGIINQFLLDTFLRTRRTPPA